VSKPPLTTTLDRTDDLAVVSVTGEVDLNTASILRAALVDATDADPPPAAVIVDLTGVEFLGSAGLAELLATRERVSDPGFRVVVVVPPTGPARRTIEVTGVDRLLTLAGSVEEARTLPT
jgi:anti-sigma B factor antagonist